MIIINTISCSVQISATFEIRLSLSLVHHFKLNGQFVLSLYSVCTLTAGSNCWMASNFPEQFSKMGKNSGEIDSLVTKSFLIHDALLPLGRWRLVQNRLLSFESNFPQFRPIHQQSTISFIVLGQRTMESQRARLFTFYTFNSIGLAVLLFIVPFEWLRLASIHFTRIQLHDESPMTELWCESGDFGGFLFLFWIFLAAYKTRWLEIYKSWMCWPQKKKSRSKQFPS